MFKPFNSIVEVVLLVEQQAHNQVVFGKNPSRCLIKFHFQRNCAKYKNCPQLSPESVLKIEDAKNCPHDRGYISRYFKS